MRHRSRHLAPSWTGVFSYR